VPDEGRAARVPEETAKKPKITQGKNRGKEDAQGAGISESVRESQGFWGFLKSIVVRRVRRSKNAKIANKRGEGV